MDYSGNDRNDGDVPALNLALREHIGDGRIATDNEKRIGHLWAVTLAKLAVDQPNHSTYQGVLAEAAPPSPGDST